jgi:hypothetical protein
MPARIPNDSFSESTRQAPSNGGNRHVISWVFLIRRAQGRKKDASRSRQDRKIRFQQDLKSHFGLDMIAPTRLHLIKRRQRKHLQMKAGPFLTLLRVGEKRMTLWAVT